ncbi:MAG: fibronectin type III domain-containing protein, partial [Actinobacteria bacterium]|nr:fibronectin type III domain-containing protein [Actinomycetota bacterium]
MARPSNGSAIVTWTAPASQGSSPITGYRVTAYYDLILQTSITFPSTATTQVFTSLVNGNDYRFKVAAINASGAGPNSAYSNTVTPRVMYPPSAPAIGPATGGDQQATVTWSTPANDGGATITAYQVTTMVGGEGVAVQTFNSAATTQVITGLTNGVIYQFRVAGVNDAGVGWSSEPSNTVTPSALPGAPTSVQAFAGNTQATVTWLAPASDGGAPITGYVVTPYVGGTAQSPRTFGTTANSQVVTGLTNGTSYTFRVAAINPTGTGTQSDPSNAVTPAVNSVPGAPTVGSVTPGDRQVTVTWTPPTDTGGLPLTGYAITPYVGSVPQA